MDEGIIDKQLVHSSFWSCHCIIPWPDDVTVHDSSFNKVHGQRDFRLQQIYSSGGKNCSWVCASSPERPVPFPTWQEIRQSIGRVSGVMPAAAPTLEPMLSLEVFDGRYLGANGAFSHFYYQLQVILMQLLCHTVMQDLPILSVEFGKVFMCQLV